jgi:hypothetical protein
VRIRRRVEGELGPIREPSWVPSVPERLRFPLIVLTVVVCAAIFLIALLIGLHRP